MKSTAVRLDVWQRGDLTDFGRKLLAEALEREGLYESLCQVANDVGPRECRLCMPGDEYCDECGGR